MLELRQQLADRRVAKVAAGQRVPIYRRPAFWASMVGAAIVIGTGVGLSAAAGSGLTFQPSPQADLPTDLGPGTATFSGAMP